jgi:hypothetical protein
MFVIARAGFVVFHPSLIKQLDTHPQGDQRARLQTTLLAQFDAPLRDVITIDRNILSLILMILNRDDRLVCSTMKKRLSRTLGDRQTAVCLLPWACTGQTDFFTSGYHRGQRGAVLTRLKAS